jgi:hypothetical protein
MNRLFILTTASLLPLAAYADAPTFRDLVAFAVRILNQVIVILVAIAFLAFIWSLTQYLFKETDGKEKGVFKNRVIAGLLGMFVIVAVWGLVRFIGGTLGIL